MEQPQARNAGGLRQVRAAVRPSGKPLGPPSKQQEVWTSTEDLFWDHMREVQNKWNTLKLNDDIWAKLIYFEQNRRLAKAYVSTPILTIDGSTNGLDGFRIGLSGIENSYRNLDSIASLRAIGQGIKLKIDQHGNILIRKLATGGGGGGGGQSAVSNGNQCSIWIKEWPSAAAAAAADATTAGSHSSANSLASSSASSSSSSSDYSRLQHHARWPMRELTSADSSYKLFDMQQFRRQLERQSGGEPLIDWRHCVSVISFVRQAPTSGAGAGAQSCSAPGLQRQAAAGKQPAVATQGARQLLGDPCWLMLINIIAIDMLKSSLCDSQRAASSPAAPPPPTSQMSSLVHSYQARQQRARPPARARIDEQRPALKSSASAASLHSERQRPLPPAASAGHYREAGEMLRRSAPPPATGGGGSQLRGAAAARRGRALRPAAGALSRSSQQLDAREAAAAARGNFFIGPPGYAGAGSLSSNNAIYTTFTGKYLDRAQRERVRSARKSSMDGLTRQRNAQQLHDDNLNAGAPLRPAGRRAPLSEKLVALAQPLEATPGANWQRHQRAQSPLVAEGARGRLAQRYQQMSNQLSAAGSPRVAFARRPMSELQQRQLSHSLSAFDLSHGHKLNLRSLKSIKMNFDSDSDSNQDELGVGPAASSSRRLAGGGGNKAEEIYRPGELGQRQQRRAAALLAFNKEASAWAKLAEKYSFDAPANRAREEVREEEGLQKSSSTISSSQLFADELDEEAEADGGGGGGGGGAATTERPAGETDAVQKHKKVSRASLASTAGSSSSSSGCADHDYFASQASSSMSSSTHTSGSGSGSGSSNAIDEGLPASQPASSSGIAGSGHTSDEQGAEAGPELGATSGGGGGGQPNNASSAALSSEDKKKAAAAAIKSGLASKLAAGLKSAAGARRDGGGGGGGQGGQQQLPAAGRPQKAAISHNRRLNVKRLLDFQQQAGQLDHHCCAASAGRPTRTMGEPRAGPHGHHHHQQEQCDDCILEHDDYDDHDHDHEFHGGQFDTTTCDCCCDCFYADGSGPLSAGDEQCSLPAGLCDCGGGGDGGEAPCAQDGAESRIAGAELAVGEEEEDGEPIYDHLPRFGQSNNAATSRPGGERRRKFLGQNSSCADLTTGAFFHDTRNDDEPAAAIAMPFGGASDDAAAKIKRAPPKELKRKDGWLERRKYIRLFPRFMFSSSSSASAATSAPATATSAAASSSSNGSTSCPSPAPVGASDASPKSGTLDRNQSGGNKFRRTRSSQNLFK